MSTSRCRYVKMPSNSVDLYIDTRSRYLSKNTQTAYLAPSVILCCNVLGSIPQYAFTFLMNFSVQLFLIYNLKIANGYHSAREYHTCRCFPSSGQQNKATHTQLGRINLKIANGHDGECTIIYSEKVSAWTTRPVWLYKQQRQL